jgi:hypothetical protein
MPAYIVTVCYTTYETVRIEADSEDAAMEKARKAPEFRSKDEFDVIDATPETEKEEG